MHPIDVKNLRPGDLFVLDLGHWTGSTGNRNWTKQEVVATCISNVRYAAEGSDGQGNINHGQDVFFLYEGPRLDRRFWSENLKVVRL